MEELVSNGLAERGLMVGPEAVVRLTIDVWMGALEDDHAGGL